VLRERRDASSHSELMFSSTKDQLILELQIDIPDYRIDTPHTQQSVGEDISPDSKYACSQSIFSRALRDLYLSRQLTACRCD